MAVFTKWIKKAVENLIDPDKEERVEHLVRVMHHGLSAQGQRFSLATAIQGLEFTPKDLELAKEKVYRTILARGWRDEKLTAKEQHVAKWVAECLEISPSKASEVNLGFAREYFANALAEAMADGVLDAGEERRLQEIASSVGMRMPDFVRSFFQREGERFLRGVFLACVADNHLSKREWNYLLSMTAKLGITHAELLQVIAPQARQFVEHVLADAKADERLSQQEEATLNWLLENLGLSPEYRWYVESEMQTLQTLTRIHNGHLPSIPAPAGIAIRSGEVVHFGAAATWRIARMLKSGPRTDEHRGVLVLTDSRLIFSSVTKSHSVRFAKIVSHRGGSEWIEVQIEGKPASTYILHESSAIAYKIFFAAVAMANQTMVAKTTGKPSRHIPRDVRQRVWQRYGGRCAECSATDYLEFDHIIPHAKGGSNADANIQLLCRRCNLKKSDCI